MKTLYLVMLDSEETGRVFCTNTAVTQPFTTLRELSELMQESAVAASDSRVNWDPFSIARGKLLILQIIIVAADGSGLHGYMRNGPDYVCFANTGSLLELIQKQAHAAIMHNHRRENARLSRQRAREASANAMPDAAEK